MMTRQVVTPKKVFKKEEKERKKQKQNNQEGDIHKGNIPRLLLILSLVQEKTQPTT